MIVGYQKKVSARARKIESDILEACIRCYPKPHSFREGPRGFIMVIGSVVDAVVNLRIGYRAATGYCRHKIGRLSEFSVDHYHPVCISRYQIICFRETLDGCSGRTSVVIVVSPVVYKHDLCFCKNRSCRYNRQCKNSRYFFHASEIRYYFSQNYTLNLVRNVRKKSHSAKIGSHRRL